MKDEYSQVWLGENRPYWLNNVTVRYDLAIERWQRRGDAFHAATRDWCNGQDLPAAGALGDAGGRRALRLRQAPSFRDKDAGRMRRPDPPAPPWNAPVAALETGTGAGQPVPFELTRLFRAAPVCALD